MHGDRCLRSIAGVHWWRGLLVGHSWRAGCHGNLLELRLLRWRGLVLGRRRRRRERLLVHGWRRRVCHAKWRWLVGILIHRWRWTGNPSVLALKGRWLIHLRRRFPDAEKESCSKETAQVSGKWRSYLQWMPEVGLLQSAYLYCPLPQPPSLNTWTASAQATSAHAATHPLCRPGPGQPRPRCIETDRGCSNICRYVLLLDDLSLPGMTCPALVQ